MFDSSSTQLSTELKRDPALLVSTAHNLAAIRSADPALRAALATGWNAGIVPRLTRAWRSAPRLTHVDQTEVHFASGQTAPASLISRGASKAEASC
ncbi:MAG: hypothetical protein L6R00_19300 [Phycisphaerae bacterium]|nr:hypothetical protein [Phycisphaerae bacterium]